MKKHLFLILPSAFIFYSPSLFFYFVSDDFFFISFKSFTSSVSFIKDFNHYTPVFWSFMYLIGKLSHNNPFYFHLTAVFIHLINTCLVFKFTNNITKNGTIASLTSLLFAFFFLHYEVIYWITGLNTSLMVMIYLLSLITLDKLITLHKPLLIVNYLIFLFLSILTHEHALTLIPVSILYVFFFKRRNIPIKKFVNIFLATLLAVLLFLLIRTMNTSTSEIVKSVSFVRFLSSFIKSFTYLTFPFPQLLDHLSKIQIGIMFFIITIVFILEIKNLGFKNRRIFYFCLSFLFIQIILFSATSLPQPRYFYLSSIPASILLMLILKSFQMKHILLIIIFLFISNIMFLMQRELEWTKTSDINRETVRFFESSLINAPPNLSYLFLNLPDSLMGPPWNAYLFRNGMEHILKYSLHNNPGSIIYGRTIDFDSRMRDDLYLFILPSSEFTYEYDYQKEKLVQKK